jgi:hypothetical protein
MLGAATAPAGRGGTGFARGRLWPAADNQRAQPGWAVRSQSQPLPALIQRASTGRRCTAPQR